MKYDYLIIGAGISGAAAAYELAPCGSVILIEAETAPSYHSTGRSAALYTPKYGGKTVRLLNQVSVNFLTNPPPKFCRHPLLTARGLLIIATPGEEEGLAAALNLSGPDNEIELITAARALELAPLLRPERVAAATYERGVSDIDVAELHQGFLRGLKDRGGIVICDKRVERLERHDGHWQAVAGDTIFSARIIVNAAGAWADQIGQMAGASSIGLEPRRRTGIIIDAPQAINVETMPAIDYVSTDAYLKPQAGKIMASPGDQTPTEPQDVRPEEFDIAVLVDWLERETLIEVKRIGNSWAGLRSFVADEAPVVGFDASVQDFFWLAGQGGYGIMMAPALGRAAAGLIVTGSLPSDLRQQGIDEADLSPARIEVPEGFVRANLLESAGHVS